VKNIPPGQFKSGITEEHRRLVLELAGGDFRTLNLIHSMERLAHRDTIYRWLIRNGITGEKLYTFFQERRFSWNAVAKEVISRIEKADKRPLIMGKDVL
jgi:hypothetical protein